ncbi:hypothetical protein B4113_1181 [Geobacillus sp. B4113_201601]|nr:hypothetical protein B4113_1181 [Geobacillus sp. B4113_201601]
MEHVHFEAITICFFRDGWTVLKNLFELMVFDDGVFAHDIHSPFYKHMFGENEYTTPKIHLVYFLKFGV